MSKDFTLTAYPVYAVRVLVEAATPQEAIDKACEAVDWNAPKRAGLPGAEWVEFSDGWECFNVSGDGAVEWRGPDGRTPLPDPRVLQNAQALADGLQRLVTHAAGLYGVMPQEAQHLSLILRPAVHLLQRVGAAAPEGLRRLLEPCQHDDWQPTDSKGHSMECVRCGALWTLAEGEVGTLIIDGVDLRLLEEQRSSLGAATVRAGDEGLHLTPDEALALTGIVNMLDAWSDEREGEAAKALRQCPDLPDDFHWANRDAVEAFEQAFRRWCAVRDEALAAAVTGIIDLLHDSTARPDYEVRQQALRMATDAMSSQAVMDQMAAQQGWSVATQLDLALQYIDNQADDAAFQDFLVQVAHEENVPLEEV